MSFRLYSGFIGSLKKYLRYPRTIEGLLVNLEDNPASLLSKVIGLRPFSIRKSIR
jgi:hypothetical protein